MPPSTAAEPAERNGGAPDDARGLPLLRRRAARRSQPDRLSAEGLSVHFEGVKALEDVTVAVDRGEILGLIGPNGAGKTTLVNALSGFARATAGAVRLGGLDITRWSPHRRARAGLLRTFQAGLLFGRLTARENVEAAASGVGTRRAEARRRAQEALEHLDLLELADTKANGLPQGTERRLGIARSLAAQPAFLLLDEPAAGLNEQESAELVETLRGVRRRWGCGILIIEHDMSVVLNLCDRVHVLDYGETLCVGAPDEVRNDPEVLRAYLGDGG